MARQLFKLMAYKDEYEVARLHLDAVERAKLDAEFGADAKIYFMLHPPLLRSLGLERKLKLGAWFVPAFRTLYRMRRLRGSRLDPFGKAKVRRVERELVGEYERLISEALELVTADTHATAVELLELPDVIRGYEEIKLRNVVLYRKRAEAILKRLRAGSLRRGSRSFRAPACAPARPRSGRRSPPPAGGRCRRPARRRTRSAHRVPGPVDYRAD